MTIITLTEAEKNLILFMLNRTDVRLTDPDAVTVAITATGLIAKLSMKSPQPPEEKKTDGTN